MDSVSQMLVSPSLVGLPFEVQLTIVCHLDLGSIARLRQTCRTLANRNLYATLSDVQTLQALLERDHSAFRERLMRSGVTKKPALSATAVPLYLRRRQLLTACIWHLVCTHNKDSSFWWTLELLYDVTNVYHRGTNNELYQLDGVRCRVTDPTLRKQLDRLEATTHDALTRAVHLAIRRRHDLGLSAMSSFCKRNKSWLGMLEVYDAALVLSKDTTLPEKQRINMLLALTPMTWFGHLDEGGCDQAAMFLGSSGHPLIVLNGIQFLANNGHKDESATLYYFSPLIHACWFHGHKQLTFQLLDLLLFALGTHTVRFTTPTGRFTRPQPALPLLFPPNINTATVEDQVFLPFVLTEASHVLIRSVIKTIQNEYQWYEVQRWFQLDEYRWQEVDAELLEWYLARAPLHLDLVHAYCHNLASLLSKSPEHASSTVIQTLLKWIPFDLVHVEVTQVQKKCNRCEQIKTMAESPHAPALLKQFVAAHPSSPMSFFPIPIEQRMQQASEIQSLLASLPPPTRTGASPPISQATGDMYTWRTFFGTFITQQTRRGTTSSVLPLFWPHIRTADPKTALNTIPFDDFMWALVQGGCFAQAVDVLKEVLESGPLSWRLSKKAVAKLGEQLEEEAAGEDKHSDFDAFVQFVKSQGLISV